ncbi:protein FAM163A [Syngnathus scovelli]|uniref:protein FAM163A n=1 Tax=Syngnathus scovelli TaxID=161590 RepID=UPI00210F4B06|nr:protein FAM163A [Syngnathus scovelli]
MSAGTIVIAGGILAGVILICIVAILCYCRLQYYCCKKNDSETAPVPAPAAPSTPLSHFPCETCDALANDGAAITPVSLEQLDAGVPCLACSPYTRRAAPQVLNGGERLGFHTYYETPLPLGYACPTPPPRPYSTQV